jgi:hypothetical protein
VSVLRPRVTFVKRGHIAGPETIGFPLVRE